MISKKTLELLSAYLDGEVNQTQKQKIEALLAKDPALREEAESMKAFSARISSTRPGPMKVPEGFRDEILKKIRQQHHGPDQSSGGAPGGGTGFLKHSWMSYLMTGTVLVGLTTYFVYQDRRNQQNIDQADQSVQMIKQATQDQKLEMPQYQGRSRQMNQGAAPSDISGLDAASSRPDAGAVGDGRVFRYGHGRESDPGDDDKAMVPMKASKHDGMAPAALPGPGLESSRAWDQQSLALKIEAYGLQEKLTSSQCLTLARKYNLNPGLLLGLMHLMPGQDSQTLALRIRRSLNQSYQQEAPQRLEQLIRDLKGQKQWTKLIKKELAPR